MRTFKENCTVIYIIINMYRDIYLDENLELKEL